MKYIKLFDKLFDFENVKDVLDRPNVSLIQENNKVEYLPDTNEDIIDYSTQYLTFEALEDGLTVLFSNDGLEYRIDDGHWTSLSADTSTSSINTGQTISFRGNLTQGSSGSYGIGTFTVSKQYNALGNIMSLLYGDYFVGKTDLTGRDSVFYNLFNNSTILISAENLILPATTLAEYCYYYMFFGCSKLTTPPMRLPATTLADKCYAYMFANCPSLVTSPALPATTLAKECYDHMFYYCSPGFKTAPELPATTLAEACYRYMFHGCLSLKTAPALPATTLATSCYDHMFQTCESLTTVPTELPATTLAEGCYKGMFRGCKSLENVPELPATTLSTNCYDSMFFNCSKLNNITMLATDVSASNCLSNWVSGVASTGTFTKSPLMNSLQSGNSGIPEGWTVEDYQE